MKFFQPVGRALAKIARALLGVQRQSADLKALMSRLGMSTKVIDGFGRVTDWFQYVEEKYGQHTSFWKKTEDAVKSGTLPVYTMEEIIYAYQIKKRPINEIKKMWKALGRDKVIESKPIEEIDVPDFEDDEDRD